MYIEEIELKSKEERKKEIIKICKRTINAEEEAELLNSLVLYESSLILELKGRILQNVLPKRDLKRHKLGNCYINAFSALKEGYEYVEGYVLNGRGRKVAHAWNMDYKGSYVDFTADYNKGLIYLGIVIPSDIVYEVGMRNGGIIYAVLPFIDIEEIS